MTDFDLKRLSARLRNAKREVERMDALIKAHKEAHPDLVAYEDKKKQANKTKRESEKTARELIEATYQKTGGQIDSNHFSVREVDGDLTVTNPHEVIDWLLVNMPHLLKQVVSLDTAKFMTVFEQIAGEDDVLLPAFTEMPLQLERERVVKTTIHWSKLDEEAMSIEGARQAAIKNARSILEQDFVVIDTETTGLRDAQVIELGIINKHGNQIYSGRFQTDAVIEPYATAVHGISKGDLEGQLHFRDVAAEIIRMIDGKAILGYNVNFDVRALRNSILAAGHQMPDIGEKYDVMMLYAQYHGEKNTQGWKKKRLVDAADDFGYKTSGAHNATTDCHLVLAVLQGIATQEHAEDFAPEPVDDGFAPVEA